MSQNADVTNTIVTPGGSEASYVVPEDTYRLLIQADTTDQFLSWTATSGVRFRIVAGAPPIEIKSRNMNGKTIFFNSAANTVEIMALSGYEEI